MEIVPIQQVNSNRNTGTCMLKAVIWSGSEEAQSF
jgi:hypothetical protein